MVFNKLVDQLWLTKSHKPVLIVAVIHVEGDDSEAWTHQHRVEGTFPDGWC